MTSDRTNTGRRLLGVLALLVFVWGCAHHRVASDLVVYVNRGILDIAPMEAQALSAYAGVVGDNYTTDQAVFDALRHQVIPGYGRFLAALKALSPRTREVEALHALYIDGAETMMQGFETKLIGLETGNPALIRDGNALIESGRIKTERWRTRLSAYYRKYGVVSKKGE